MVSYFARVLINRIQLEGIPVTEVVPATEFTDTMIVINERIHVTFTTRYIYLVRTLPDGRMVFMDATRDNVITKLKKLIAKK